MIIMCGFDPINILRITNITLKEAWYLDLEPFEEKRNGSFWEVFRDTRIKYKNHEELHKAVRERQRKKDEFISKYRGKNILVIEIEGEKKEYLDIDCGFDVVSKKTEIESALKFFKEKELQKIKEMKDILREKIIYEFNAVKICRI